MDTPDRIKPWRFRRAALYGLILQVLGIVSSGDWPRVKAFLISGYFEPTVAAIAELSATPLLFVIIASIRNLLVRLAERRAHRT
jgi:hypothetical protein